MPEATCSGLRARELLAAYVNQITAVQDQDAEQPREGGDVKVEDAEQS